MTIDLKTFLVTVEPASGESFDPREIPEAVKRAGFGAGSLRLTVVGTLSVSDDQKGLQLESGQQVWMLVDEDGEQTDWKTKLVGRRVRLTGELLDRDEEMRLRPEAVEEARAQRQEPAAP